MQIRKKLLVTKCPTYSDFFEHFNMGLHKWMGDITHPDRAISHEIVQELMSTLEQDWLSARASKHLTLALEGAFYLLAFTLALRGEEVPLVELCGMITHLK